MTNIKGRYARIEVSLDETESDKELFLTGDYLGIVSITGEGTCEMKFDHRHSQIVDLREITEITGAFERVYFSSDGGGGACTFFVGTGMAMHVSSDLQKLSHAGDVTSGVIVTSNTIKQFCDKSMRFGVITFYNDSASYQSYLGKHYPDDPNEFIAKAFVMNPRASFKFENIDLYEMACFWGGVGAANLEWIGMNRY